MNEFVSSLFSLSFCDIKLVFSLCRIEYITSSQRLHPVADWKGFQLGSPPRARGAVFCQTLHKTFKRITPACSGSSGVLLDIISCIWDHPRVRGEQHILIILLTILQGSPPRARGAGCKKNGMITIASITPACAGSRCSRACICEYTRDHPRVRGEQIP